MGHDFLHNDCLVVGRVSCNGVIETVIPKGRRQIADYYVILMVTTYLIEGVVIFHQEHLMVFDKVCSNAGRNTAICYFKYDLNGILQLALILEEELRTAAWG